MPRQSKQKGGAVHDAAQMDIEDDPEEKLVNTFSKTKLERFLKRIRAEQNEIDKIMADAKDEASPHREAISNIKKEAHEAGIPRKEFNALIRYDRMTRLVEGIRDGLSKDEAILYDDMRRMLGFLADTPLGEAALKGAVDAPAEAATQH